MISTRSLSRRTVFPMTPGSPPKAVPQYACPISVTLGAPGSRSAGRNARPRAGRRPVKSKKVSATSLVWTTAAPPPAWSVALDGRIGSTPSRVVAWSRQNSTAANCGLMRTWLSGISCQRTTSRSLSRNGNGWMTTCRTTVQSAVAAPMPSPSVPAAVSSNIGCAFRRRAARRTLCRKSARRSDQRSWRSAARSCSRQ